MKHTETIELKGAVIILTRETDKKPPQTFRVDTRSGAFCHAMKMLGWQTPDEAKAVKSHESHALDAASYVCAPTYVIDQSPAVQELIAENGTLRRKLDEALRANESFCMPKAKNVKELQAELNHEKENVAQMLKSLEHREAVIAKLKGSNAILEGQIATLNATIGLIESGLTRRVREVDQLTKDLAIAHDEIKRLREASGNAVLAHRIAELERKVGGRHE